MCDPVIAGTIIGGGQAALGVIGQNQGIAARNKNRAKLYGRDLTRIHAEHLSNLGNYYLRGVDAELTWSDNLLKASQAIETQQTLINEGLANALRASEDDYVKMVSDPRIAKSLERSGKSAKRVGRAFKAAQGRAKAQRAGKIDAARDKASLALAEIQRLKTQSDRKLI